MWPVKKREKGWSRPTVKMKIFLFKIWVHSGRDLPDRL